MIKDIKFQERLYIESRILLYQEKGPTQKVPSCQQFSEL